MGIEVNKAVVRRYPELWDTGNLAIVDEIIAKVETPFQHER
jgi:hypothetical protein